MIGVIRETLRASSWSEPMTNRYSGLFYARARESGVSKDLKFEDSSLLASVPGFHAVRAAIGRREL